MRRFGLAVMIALLSVLGTSVLAPQTHAQTVTPRVAVDRTSANFNQVVTVTGTGFAPNYYAYFYYQRPDGTYNAFDVQTDAAGRFVQQLGFLASHGTGTEYISAYDYASARWTPYVTVMVGGTSGPTLTASPNPVNVDHQTTVTGTGFTPNNYVYFRYTRPNRSTNAFYVTTDAYGTFHLNLGFLRAYGCGHETVQATDYRTGASAAPLTITITGC